MIHNAVSSVDTCCITWEPFTSGPTTAMAEMSRVVDTDVMAEDETGDVDEDDNVQATSHNELRLRARLAGPSWERAKEAYEDWNRTVRSFLGEAECCSLCGEVHFHTSASNTLRMKKCNPYGDDLNVPPALKNNPNLPETWLRKRDCRRRRPNRRAEGEDEEGEEKWLLCDGCQNNTQERAAGLLLHIHGRVH